MECLKCSGKGVFEVELCFDEVASQWVEFVRCINCGRRVYEMEKEYLGNRVYIKVVGQGLKLFMDYGEGPVNEISLEEKIIPSLLAYIKRFQVRRCYVK